MSNEWTIYCSLSYFELSHRGWTVCFYQRENGCYRHAQVNKEKLSSGPVLAKAELLRGRVQHLRNNFGKLATYNFQYLYSYHPKLKNCIIFSQLQVNRFFFWTICPTEGYFSLFLSFASFPLCSSVSKNHLESMCLFHRIVFFAMSLARLSSSDSLCDMTMWKPTYLQHSSSIFWCPH